MADDKKTPAKAEGPIKRNVRAVFGELRHQFTNEVFDTGFVKPVEVDSFIEVQVEAGKLEYVD